jgi:hypothetical protein
LDKYKCLHHIYVITKINYLKYEEQQKNLPNMEGFKKFKNLIGVLQLGSRPDNPPYPNEMLHGLLSNKSVRVPINYTITLLGGQGG